VANTTLGIEIIIQLCRLQIQREREKLMTPNLRGTLESLKKLKSFVDDESLKLDAVIANAVTEVPVAFKAAHDTVRGMRGTVNEINEYLGELKKSNGADPLEDSQDGSAPRSSEVARLVR
jgi:hypothetical protein